MSDPTPVDTIVVHRRRIVLHYGVIDAYTAAAYGVVGRQAPFTAKIVRLDYEYLDSGWSFTGADVSGPAQNSDGTSGATLDRAYPVTVPLPDWLEELAREHRPGDHPRVVPVVPPTPGADASIADHHAYWRALWTAYLARQPYDADAAARHLASIGEAEAMTELWMNVETGENAGAGVGWQAAARIAARWIVNRPSSSSGAANDLTDVRATAAYRWIRTQAQAGRVSMADVGRGWWM